MIPTMTQHPALSTEPFIVECPSCHQRASFSYKGQQVFPEKVAQKAGLPSIIHLWHCSECQTTLSHMELLKCN